MSAALRMALLAGRRRRMGGGATVTWNPADATANVSLSGGNLVYQKTADNGGYAGGCRATRGVTAGKWYWEVLVGSSGGNYAEAAAVATASAALGNALGAQADGWVYFVYTGGNHGKQTNGSAALGWGVDYAPGGSVVMAALDAGAGALWFGCNGNWLGVTAQSDPANGLNAAFSAMGAGPFYPALNCQNTGSQFTGRFRAADQAYAAPAGFAAIGT